MGQKKSSFAHVHTQLLPAPRVQGKFLKKISHSKITVLCIKIL